MQKTKHNRFAMAASAALLIGGCAGNTSQTSASNGSPLPTPADSGSDIGRCVGANSCKGASACATSNNSCAKQNTCRGKGWLPLPKSECDAHGGRFMGFKHNKKMANKKC